jgi:hypothetical protein
MTELLDFDLAWGGYYACVSRNSAEVSIIRLLDFNRDAYHASLFSERFDDIPEPGVVESLKPSIGHVPVDARGLLNLETMVLISRKPLTESDLYGYMFYLEEFEVPEAERDELAKSLMAFSSETPMALRLSISDDELQIEERLVLTYCIHCGSKVSPYRYSSGADYDDGVYGNGLDSPHYRQPPGIETYRCSCREGPIIAPDTVNTGMNCPYCGHFQCLHGSWCGLCGSEMWRNHNYSNEGWTLVFLEKEFIANGDSDYWQRSIENWRSTVTPKVVADEVLRFLQGDHSIWDRVSEGNPRLPRYTREAYFPDPIIKSQAIQYPDKFADLIAFSAQEFILRFYELFFFEPFSEEDICSKHEVFVECSDGQAQAEELKDVLNYLLDSFSAFREMTECFFGEEKEQFREITENWNSRPGSDDPEKLFRSQLGQLSRSIDNATEKLEKLTSDKRASPY